MKNKTKNKSAVEPAAQQATSLWKIQWFSELYFPHLTNGPRFFNNLIGRYEEQGQRVARVERDGWHTAGT